MRHALVLAPVIAVLAATPAHAAPVPRVLFTSDWSTTWQIYAVTADGSHVAQLTFGPVASCPEWYGCGRRGVRPSPDGRRVLFTSGRALDGTSRLYVAGADGRNPRRVAESRRGILAEWAPDSQRFAYATAGKVLISTGRERMRSWITFNGAGRPVADGVDAQKLAWSRRGRLAFATSWSLHVAGAGIVAETGRPREFAWSPDGKQLVYEASDGVYVVTADGSTRRRIGDVVCCTDSLQWSPSGRFISWVDRHVKVFDRVDGTTKLVNGGAPTAWSGRREVLAYDGDDGLTYYDAVENATRIVSTDKPVELSWAPDGRTLAYVAALVRDRGTFQSPRYHPRYLSGDLKVVPPASSPRTVIGARAAYGGAREIRWSPSVRARYRSAVGRSIAATTPVELLSRWPILGLSASGPRIAYESCNHVFVWTPATGAVEQAEPVASGSQHGCGPVYEAYRHFDLAIAGTTVAHGASTGNMGQYFWLGGVRLDAPGMFTLGAGIRSAGSPTRGALGELAGDGALFVYSEWDEDALRWPNPFRVFTTRQRIRRIGEDGCPCPILHEAEGALIPVDVDNGRILVSHAYSLSIHDPVGRNLLSVPPTKGAVLSGRDLVAVDGAKLLHYDATSGALLHEWPLPTEATGRRCANPGFFCPDRGELILEDAARGRVAYIYEGNVHVLRLSDGLERVVAPGTLAAFMDQGLVVANDRTLRVLPFDSMP